MRRRCCSGCGTTGPGRRAPCGPRWRRRSPRSSSWRGPRRPTRWWSSPPTRGCGRRSRCSRTWWTSRAGPRSGRSPSSPRSGWRSGGPSRGAYRCASSTCRRRTRWRGPTRSRRRGGRRPRTVGAWRARARRVRTRRVRTRCGSTPSPCSPRRPGTTTRSGGGRTSSSTAGRRATRSRPSRRWARPWGSCARPTETAGTPVTWCARRTCGSRCAPRRRSSGPTGSPSCAGPGTCPRCGAGPPWRPTGRCSRGCPR